MPCVEEDDGQEDRGNLQLAALISFANLCGLERAVSASLPSTLRPTPLCVKHILDACRQLINVVWLGLPYLL